MSAVHVSVSVAVSMDVCIYVTVCECLLFLFVKRGAVDVWMAMAGEKGEEVREQAQQNQSHVHVLGA